MDALIPLVKEGGFVGIAMLMAFFYWRETERNKRLEDAREGDRRLYIELIERSITTTEANRRVLDRFALLLGQSAHAPD